MTEFYKVRFLKEESGDKGVMVKRYAVYKIDEDFETKGSYTQHETEIDGKLQMYCTCPSPGNPCKHVMLIRVARAQYSDPEEMGSKFWCMESWGKNIREYQPNGD